MASSKEWANRISRIGTRLFFFLIILQIPLFRISCRSGMCTTPIQVTSSQLISTQSFPISMVKALLYPGTLLNHLIKERRVPTWDSVLSIYNLTDINNATPLPDLQHLEVLAGSYFCVAGAFVGLIKPGRMSMFGTLLVVWGLVKEGILGKSVNTDPSKATFVYPTMFLALIFAFSSVKYDLNRAVRGAPARSIAKPLQSSTKSKIK